MDLKQISILDLLPTNLLSDGKVVAAAQAIDKQMQSINDVIPKLLLYKNLDLQSEHVIDELAKEENVDFYDSTLPIEVKRELVRNSSKWNRRKGTASVVEEVVRAVFDDAVVTEWGGYNGEPYHFRVTTRQVVSDPNKLIELTKIINSVKNARSHLEALEIERDITNSIYVGTLIHTRKVITVYQEGVR